jgi:hypothetical protein
MRNKVLSFGFWVLGWSLLLAPLRGQNTPVLADADTGLLWRPSTFLTNATNAAAVRGAIFPTFTGNGTKTVRVNAAETAFEYTTAGAGDVAGPSASIDGELAVFNSTTGKVLRTATAAGTLVKWLVSNRQYDAVVTVSNTVGGITTALNAISDNSATKRYLIYVLNGSYSDTITIKEYVDIVGESRAGVIITNSTDADTIRNTSSTGRVGNVMLSNLTVVNTGATGVKYAFHFDASQASVPLDIILNNVTATGGNNAAMGVGLFGGQRLYVIESTFTNTNGGNGIYAHNATTAQTAPAGMYLIDVTATGDVDGFGYWGFESNQQDFVVIIGGTYEGTSRDIDFQTSVASESAIIYVSPATTGTVVVDAGTRLTSPPFIPIPFGNLYSAGDMRALGNITAVGNVYGDKVIATDDIETTSGSTSYSVATSKAVVGTGGGAPRFTWIRSSHSANKKWFDAVAAGDAVTVRVIADDGSGAASIASFLGDGSSANSGYLLLPGTTAATTGGLGTLVTYGGIYAALNGVFGGTITAGSSATVLTTAAGLVREAAIEAAIARDTEVAAAYQPLDADLTDLADGELTGSKVGTGINADNVTSGTIAEARIHADIARDSEVTTAVSTKLAATDVDTSAELRAILGDESGTGALIFAGGDIGAATGTSLTLSGGSDFSSVASSQVILHVVGGAPRITFIRSGSTADRRAFDIISNSDGSLKFRSVEDDLGAAIDMLSLSYTGAVSTGTDLTVNGAATTTGGINLGHASDTTLTRVSAGVIAVEGVTQIGTTAIDTNAELRAITVGLGAAVQANSSTFASPATSNPLALTANDCYGFVLYYGATGEIDLPAGVVGMNGIIYNTGAFTITIDPNGSEIIVRDGTAQSAGVSMTLSSGAGNYVALHFDGTRWVTLGYKGTLGAGS